jgi:RHS repeat-associated protein
MGQESRWLFGGRVQADAAGRPTAIDLGEVRVEFAGNGQRYRHLDFRGNVKFVSDETGQVRSHYHYDAYGLRQTLGSEDDSVRFVARSQIGELMILGARVYDPAVGRFLSPDPVLQHVNQYAYTLGNPVWFVDPTGLDFESVFEGILNTTGLVTAGASLFFVAGPAAAVLAGIGLTIAVLNFAFWLAHAMVGAPANGRGAIEARPVEIGTPGWGTYPDATDSCSPIALTSMPGLGDLYWVLIALQLLLAPLLIRSRAARRRRTGR